MSIKNNLFRKHAKEKGILENSPVSIEISTVEAPAKK